MASALDHIERTLAEAYRKEIDQEENVWRSSPFPSPHVFATDNDGAIDRRRVAYWSRAEVAYAAGDERHVPMNPPRRLPPLRQPTIRRPIEESRPDGLVGA